MMRRAWLIAAIIGAIALPMDSAYAGGAPLTWHGDRPFAVGEIVRGHTGIYFNPLTGDIGDGPYYAYLVRGRGWPVSMKKAARIGLPLGQLDVTRSSRKWGDASLTFEVPDVPTGDYVVYHCNSPCTKSLGDLWPTAIRVAETELEGFVHARTDRVRDRVLARIERSEGRVTKELQQVQQSLGGRITGLDIRVRTLAEQAASPSQSSGTQREGWPLPELVAAFVAGCAAALVSRHVIARRRRSRRFADFEIEEGMVFGAAERERELVGSDRH